MRTTFEAILVGDQLQWIGEAPESDRPIRVSIQIESAEGAPARGDGRLVAERMREVARATGGIRSIADPVEWQREQREDRVLPGRES